MRGSGGGIGRPFSGLVARTPMTQVIGAPRPGPPPAFTFQNGRRAVMVKLPRCARSCSTHWQRLPLM
ncbi:hypothetical protein D3C85_825900 [compost metagenome]